MHEFGLSLIDIRSRHALLPPPPPPHFPMWMFCAITSQLSIDISMKIYKMPTKDFAHFRNELNNAYM